MKINQIATAHVEIEINDDRVLDRYTDPKSEDHGKHPYGLKTQTEIIQHLCHNAISNGVEDITRLDGWADMESGAATMFVKDVYFDDAFTIADA